MISQIDEKLEKLINLEEVTKKDLVEYFGSISESDIELIEILKNLRSHIRTYGRKATGLEKYLEKLKKTSSL